MRTARRQQEVRRAESRPVYLAEMHFVKHDFVGMADAPKSGDKGQECYDNQGHSEVPLRRDCFFAGLDNIVEDFVCFIHFAIGF